MTPIQSKPISYFPFVHQPRPRPSRDWCISCLGQARLFSSAACSNRFSRFKAKIFCSLVIGLPFVPTISYFYLNLFGQHASNKMTPQETEEFEQLKRLTEE